MKGMHIGCREFRNTFPSSTECPVNHTCSSPTVYLTNVRQCISDGSRILKINPRKNFQREFPWELLWIRHCAWLQFVFEVPMKRKLSLSYLKEVLK